jgi:hypothetical protein
MKPKIRSNIVTELRRAVESQEAENRKRYKALRAEAKATEAARVRLTREDIVGATRIRFEFGWRHVIRVNAKSVTVRPFMFPDPIERVPFDKILEARP